MMLTKEEFKNLALLARLDPEDESLAGLLDDLNQIVAYVDKINELNDLNVEEYYTNIDVRNALRDDRSQPVLEQDSIGAIAPEWDNGRFVVPGVIESE